MRITRAWIHQFALARPAGGPACAYRNVPISTRINKATTPELYALGSGEIFTITKRR